VNLLSNPQSIVIISISYFPTIGGLQSHVKLFADFASKIGHRVTIVTVKPNPSMGYSKERLESKFIIYRLHPLLWINDSPMINPVTLFQVLDQINPNIVHVVKPFPIGLDVGVLYSVLRKKRVVCTIINEVILPQVLQYSLFRLYRFFTWLIWGKVIKKFSYSSYQYFKAFSSLQRYVNELIIVPPYFLPFNVLPITKKEKSRKKEIMGVSTTQFLVIFVGGLRKRLLYKRLDILIRAWYIFHSKSIDAQLLIVGDGPLRPKFEHFVKRLGLSSSVRFLGNLERNFYQKFLEASDCLVLPSKDNNEGFGIVITEAMQAGTIPLISNLPGPKGAIDADSFKSSKFILCFPGDAYSLERALWKAYRLHRDQNYIKMNFSYLERNFSESIVVDAVRRFYTT
jgi:glycosyltransferase involved in cell wall biosynthesis